MTARLNVFVHLARDKDVDQWRAARAAGSLVGINDDTPYGYGRAERMGCNVTFSRSGPETYFAQFVRLALRVILGFDLVHAWRHRAAMAQADVVWTHTESQFLGVAWVLPPGPKLIGQAVWLYDRWARLDPLRRAMFRRLIQRVDVLTTLSDDNLAIARGLFPGKRAEMIPFGIPAEHPLEPAVRENRPIRVIALGNDRHRDWATLVAAARGTDDIAVEVFSGTIDRTLACDAPNVVIGKLRTNADLAAAMARATMMCVPLSANHHASGITVVEEAVLAGLPVVATDVGGLRGYFGDDAVRYVPVGDAAALRAALREVAADPAVATAMAQRAQAHLVAAGLDAEGYVRRHVELSRELMAAR
ncbi:glycosyltransferase [Glacieibacterium megasporae]|uniref:glycosyltransferase n=1 Tax=Glacieibacterium megasporae TaxID=2835787 RepID=UPI001C1E1498|nr:glycosyltransferase [Polymorphobacter megasporae]UAJ11591.1 glycosyltransferase [Polymorphobacter megasporae]